MLHEQKVHLHMSHIYFFSTSHYARQPNVILRPCVKVAMKLKRSAKNWSVDVFSDYLCFEITFLTLLVNDTIAPDLQILFGGGVDLSPTRLLFTEIRRIKTIKWPATSPLQCSPPTQPSTSHPRWSESWFTKLPWKWMFSMRKGRTIDWSPRSTDNGPAVMRPAHFPPSKWHYTPRWHCSKFEHGGRFLCGAEGVILII